MSLEVTYCKDCKHYEKFVDTHMYYPMQTGAPTRTAVYDRCMSDEPSKKAATEESKKYKTYTDFVTGQKVVEIKSEYRHEPVYMDYVGADCRSVNNGNCQYFEKKES